MAQRIQMRRDTSTNWATSNPVLAAGEHGVAQDTGEIRVGDGATAWSQLPVWASPYWKPKVINHVWRRDGWTPFAAANVISDNSVGADVMVNARSVPASRGRQSSPRTSGNHREVALRTGTNWADSEMRSIWYPPSAIDPAIMTPQMGHMHRVAKDNNGIWSGVMIDQNIISQAYGQTFLAKWSWHDGGVTPGDPVITAATTVGDLPHNAPQITSYGRVSFMGGWADLVQVDNLRGMVTGDTVTVAGVPAPFAGARAVVSAFPGPSGVGNTGPALMFAGSGVSAVALTPSTGSVSYPLVTGGITPREIYPWHVASRLVGNIAQFKKWRTVDAEPSWDDPVQSATIDISSEVTITIQPVGLCGLVSNHLHGSGYIEFGDVTFTNLGAI